MKKAIFSFLCLFCIPVNANATIYRASDCSYASVSAMVALATYNDVVVIPPGAATWDTAVSITKGIIVSGSGIAATVITVGTAGEAFAYAPDNTTVTNNYFFELCDLKIVASTPATDDGLAITTTDTTSCRIKVHDIDFYDLHRAIDAGGGDALRRGNIFGVVYNCKFSLGSNPFYIAAGNCDSYDTFGEDYGSLNNLYFETNSMYEGTANDLCSFGGGQGGRYVSRFNIYNGSNEGSNFLYDIHGNQWDVTGDHTSMMVVEIYRNTFNDTDAVAQFVDQRGGRAIVFDNTLTGTDDGPTFSFKEEYGDKVATVCDTYTFKVHESYEWSNTFNAAEIVPTVDYDCCAVTEAWQEAHAYGTNYCFNPTASTAGHCFVAASPGGTSTAVPPGNEPDWDLIAVGDTVVDGTVTWENTGVSGGIDENTDFWVLNAAFTAGVDTTLATGIGVGTRAQMDIVTTCTEGVGFWVTDEGSWNDTGADGRLYTCGASNNWTVFYEPLAYPHPWRGSRVKWWQTVQVGTGINSISVGEGSNTISINSN